MFLCKPGDIFIYCEKTRSERGDMGENTYATLSKHITAEHLLDRQPLYYTWKILFAFGTLALSIALIAHTGSTWWQLLNAAFLAFAFGQIAFLTHDAGHQEIFTKSWQNNLVGYCTGGLLLGMSYDWWKKNHNQHHSNPNHIDVDPDIDVPILAFSESQALAKRGLQRSIVKRQSWLFFPILSLAALNLRRYSVLALFHGAEHPIREGALLFAHAALYLGALFMLLPFWLALLFLLVHQLLFGLYLGAVFAPNHKGMLLISPKTKLDFLHKQVLTARNVRANFLTDFWYGGLNYQIEHHLFPTMPRNKFRQAQRIIKMFCSSAKLPYHETSMVQSYREILQYLRQVSAPLRAA